MTVRSAVEQEVRDLIRKHGRITFARFMQSCLYSPNGGFYADRRNRISAHFRTSSTSHPVFGALIARQLEQMWHILGEPPVFQVIEVGSGDGILAQSIVDACRRTAPQFTDALRYVAADYEPGWLQSNEHTLDWQIGATEQLAAAALGTSPRVQQVKTAGAGAFRNIIGCILSNEMIDNFPVHRFAVRDGQISEIYVTLDDGKLTEVLGEPSTPRIEERLTGLGLSLLEGTQGEVNLAMEDWIVEASRALDRGFVLTIDYGQPAAELYSPDNTQDTLVCFNRHDVGADPYRDIGQQDITCHVDFTSLMHLGERHGLTTAGYTLQSRFLENLGFSSHLDALATQGLSAARTELNRIAMMTLVDPADYGDFKVLAQAKGFTPGSELLGFQDPDN